MSNQQRSDNTWWAEPLNLKQKNLDPWMSSWMVSQSLHKEITVQVFHIFISLTVEFIDFLHYTIQTAMRNEGPGYPSGIWHLLSVEIYLFMTDKSGKDILNIFEQMYYYLQYRAGPDSSGVWTKLLLVCLVGVECTRHADWHDKVGESLSLGVMMTNLQNRCVEFLTFLHATSD